LRKIKLLISYDGGDFLGWQRQSRGRSVQAEIEAALSRIYDQPVKIVGSGRTDAGAHAVGQVAHFEAPKILDGEARLQRALNSLLPDSVVIKGVWLAPDDFHALFSARRKTYVYRIWNHPVRSALWRGRALWIPHDLDLDFLNALAESVIGERDFKSFQTAGTPVKSTVRKIDRCAFIRRGHLVEFRVRGNGFLKQMVRNLLGTFLYLDRRTSEKAPGIKALEAIFMARDRQAAKATAPAHGLYLYRVEYPPALDNKCRKL
jgi:tRNA pseudouridine38-40 synthase